MNELPEDLNAKAMPFRRRIHGGPSATFPGALQTGIWGELKAPEPSRREPIVKNLASRSIPREPIYRYCPRAPIFRVNDIAEEFAANTANYRHPNNLPKLPRSQAEGLAEAGAGVVLMLEAMQRMLGGVDQ